MPHEFRLILRTLLAMFCFHFMTTFSFCITGDQRVASSRLTAGKDTVLMRAIRNEYSSYYPVVILKIWIYYNIKIVHFDIRLVAPTPCFD